MGAYYPSIYTGGILRERPERLQNEFERDLRERPERLQNEFERDLRESEVI